MRNLTVLSLLFAAVQVHALRLQYFGETAIKTGTQFEKTVIGGLSGIAWEEGKLYAVSDDKGKSGEPRFYEFELKLQKKKVQIKPLAVHFIRGVPKEVDQKTVTLDAEGLVRLPNGDFLISTEGSGNAKPRIMPQIFRVNKTGEWLSELEIPKKFLPEATGRQKTGVQNNGGFEGLTSFANGKFVFSCVELPLEQDRQDAEGKRWVRILKFEDNGEGVLKPVAEYAYALDPLRDNDLGKEVFRGVSEILAVSETKLLVMERGLRVSPKSLLSSAVSLYVADLSKGTNVANMSKLVEGKFTAVEKSKVLDFEADLTKERPGKKVDNFEGLAWGPVLPDGRRSLLVMVDNNFSNKETTELVVFAVEGELE